MVFSSSFFIFVFLPILVLTYFLSKENGRNIVLLVGSLIFYAWGEPKYIFLMCVSILLNYFLGIIIENGKHRKAVLVISIIFNLSILFVFKYLNFLVDIIKAISQAEIDMPSISLPIGISFFTFQIMSYVIDVYRKDVKAQKNVFSLALYISLFPQLIAGPIVRYIDVEKQINYRESTFEKVYCGIRRFVVGFSKKVLIADQLAPLVDEVFAGNYPSVWCYWIGIIAYTLQIYYDFSGYSDMAIGLGGIFGFDFEENFNYPYISKSIQEFWRRWHISLSSWFRDYVYIPLGGSRHGTFRTYINLIVVFFLTGLWHGASLNFVIWGLYYAFFLVLERIGFKKVILKMPTMIQHFYVIIVVMIGWVFFRADSISQAVVYLKSMFISTGKDYIYFKVLMNRQYWVSLIIGIIFLVPFTKYTAKMGESKIGVNLSNGIILFLFLLGICYMIGSGYSPFLYFRF